MGFDPINREEASPVFRPVCYCRGTGALIITTKMSICGETELLACDEFLSGAILDCFPHPPCALPVRAHRLRDIEGLLQQNTPDWVNSSRNRCGNPVRLRPPFAPWHAHSSQR